ncbi:beta-propeller domain-containing protein [Nitrososphaera viennensis]|nr:beta-propeller domain-containing protein [Nitrososphaera viennensis]UVS69388.1 beta-propeller domain-containing protein [Nitrososphaera viennensis]
MARYSMYGMAGIGIAAAIGFVLVLGSIGGNIATRGGPGPTTFVGGNGTTATTGIPPVFTVAPTQNIAKFSSVDELRAFLTNVEASRNAFSTAQTGIPENFSKFNLGATADSDARTTAPPAPGAVMGPSSASGEAATFTENGQRTGVFSGTNNQVAGVDEPDFVKNDGKYAYVLSGDKLTISDVYPPENATIVAKVGLDIKNGQYLQEMFLNNDTLVVFYTEYAQDYVIPQYEFAPQPVYTPKTHALVLDVSDRANPKTVHDYVVSGTYHDARMIGDRVYLVTASDLYSYRQPLVPKITESSRTVVAPDIYYFQNPEPYYNFNTVTSIGLSDKDDIDSKTFMMNPASTLYVSQDNIYIAYPKYLPYNYYEQSSRDRFFKAVVPLLPQDAQAKVRAVDADTSVPASDKWDRIARILEDTYNGMSESEKTQLFDKIQKSLADYDAQAQKDATKTVIHRIAIGPNGEIDYGARGEVPGRLLNQFSMDESGDRFRVATTVEYYSPYGQGLYSNVYVLDKESMQTVGKLEQIQPGETMYSTRFIGDRLYLVTFQRIDPFFVIDLSEDTPKVLGELKLPGYSTYLHPYDEDHVIGIGKDTKDNGYGGITQTGVKLALFDVSDVANPKLVDDYVIPGQGTDSEVLWDHKALLFSKEEPNVLSIPVNTYDAEGKYAPDGRYIPPKVWRGFYVFGVSPDSGIALKGTVEHSSNATDPYYNYYYGMQVSRSFYIGDVLYTVSAGNLIKMNDIDTLADLGQLQIGSTGDVIKYPVPLDAPPKQ